MKALTPPDEAAIALLRLLKHERYEFHTPTRDTFHINRLRRPFVRSASLTDIFGWTRRFREADAPSEFRDLMESAGMLSAAGFGLMRCSHACASIGDTMLFHTSLSDTSKDAVFFGPDTYRFATLLRRQAHRFPPSGRVVDLGTGTGAGALILSRLRPDLQLVVSDINPAALHLARINLAASQVQAEFIESDGLANIGGPIDGVIANPPYLGGGIGRTYRRGGGSLGSALSIEWVQQAAARIEPGGAMLLYTGSAIVDGTDTIRNATEAALLADGYAVDYEEIDPDIFGRTLWLPAYWNVSRIAAVTLVAAKPRTGTITQMPLLHG